MCVCVCVCVCGMVGFGEFDKMIKRNGKVNKSNTYNGFSGNISLSDVLLLIKNEILSPNPL